MSWLTAILDLASKLLGYLGGRQAIANDPAIKKNKAAQQEQDEKDLIEQLTQTAMSDPDPAKRFAAAEELRKLDSE